MSSPITRIPDKHQSRGQSFLEVAIFVPIFLMLFSGIVEFGFLFNYYLNILDGPREGARFGADISPFIGSGTSVDDPNYYVAVSNEALGAIRPIILDPATDDIVVSVFAIKNNSGTVVVTRYPNAGNLAGESASDNTVGEWHLYGHGGGCNENTDLTCHNTRFSSADIATRVSGGPGSIPPNMGVIMVELYYGYKQVLKLPWLLPFMPDPMKIHTYTIMPVPAAEPQ